jgi:predicted AlkP superfamily phosphohydrolase/phosphomutase
MAEEHGGLNNGRFDERAYLAQCELVIAERERMMRCELERFTEGLFFQLYDTPDRVQHMLWRFRDPAHPGYNPDLAREYGNAIEEQYSRCDRLLGPALDKADENTLLIALSDHGFNTFRRAFDTNSWLHKNGLLKLKNGVKPAQDMADAFAAVDWPHTFAYAVGLGGIYLNLKGREREGIVEEGTEAERVRQAIGEGLTGVTDGAEKVIRSVSRREDLYSGAYAANAPDLLVNFCPGYRVSWESAVGGFANSMIEDNLRKWGGDHIIDPEAVSGILFMNCQAQRVAANKAETTIGGAPSIIDLAPTILNYLEVPVPQSMEGKNLLS